MYQKIKIQTVRELMDLYGFNTECLSSCYTQSSDVATGTTLGLVNGTLKALGEKGIDAKEIKSSSYSSSSEYNSGNFWRLDMGDADIWSSYKDDGGPVRVSLEF